jgi:hypothetical protein
VVQRDLLLLRETPHFKVAGDVEAEYGTHRLLAHGVLDVLKGGWANTAVNNLYADCAVRTGERFSSL